MEMQRGRVSRNKVAIIGLLLLLLVIALMVSCQDDGATDSAAETGAGESTADTSALSGDAGAIAEARGLTPDDVLAALKTYTPSGVHDEYIMFASGGHGGQVYVIGMPSMRIIKQIAVFTPEPWQGYGYGAQGTMEVLASGNAEGSDITWGDTHHPALSETAGDYDGQFLFINDKANGRVAVIDPSSL